MAESDKWRLVLSMFNNTILDVNWSVEHPEPEADNTGEVPGPITEKTNPPTTSFGVVGNANPNGVHGRPTIK